MYRLTSLWFTTIAFTSRRRYLAHVKIILCQQDHLSRVA